MSVEDNGFRRVRADITKIRNTQWVWTNRIERVGLNLLVGSEGLGKGFFVVHLFSKLTNGNLPGCYARKKTQVAVVAHEDSGEEWDKRMDAAQADHRMWYRLERTDMGIIDFREHLEEMCVSLKKYKTNVVYFDQLQDHLGLTTEANNNKQVRNALMPLHATLTSMGICGIATMHPNKNKGGSARDKIAGASAPLQIVRTAMFMTEHPMDPEVRVVTQIKSNHGSLPESVEFEIEDTPRDYRPNGRYVKTGVIDRLRVNSLKFEDVRYEPEHKSKMKKLDESIREFLKDGKQHSFPELREVFPESEFSYNVMNRAAKRLGVQIVRSEFQGHTKWSLPRVRDGQRARRGPQSKV